METPELLAEQRRRFGEVMKYFACDPAIQDANAPPGVAVGVDLCTMGWFLSQWAPNLRRKDLISTEAEAASQAIVTITTDIPRQQAPLFLGADAVRREKGWAAVREQARAGLRGLGLPLGTPDFRWLARATGDPPSGKDDSEGLAMLETTQTGSPSIGAILYSPGVHSIGSSPYWVVSGPLGKEYADPRAD